LVTEAEKRFTELKASKLAYLKLTESTDLWLRSLCPEKLDDHEAVSLTEDGVLIVDEGSGNGLTSVLKRGKLHQNKFNSFSTE
jgi:hypothetical protein